MAEFLPKNLGEGQLPNSKTTLYTVPAGKTAIIRSILLVNTNASSRTVNIYANFSGTSRRIVPANYVLGGSAKMEDTSAVTLEAGDFIEGDASVAAQVDYIISGVQTA